MDPAVRGVDRALASICGRLTFVLRSTPVNARTVFDDLSAGRTPRPFEYASNRDDVAALQAELDAIDVDTIDDPSLHALLSDKHEELAIKLDMLRHLGRARYRSGSIRLFGDVEEDLLEEAHELVTTIPYAERRSAGPMLDADEIARRGRAEISFYAARLPGFTAEVHIRSGITAGMLCSRGNFLIDASCSVAPQRIQALLHHEVGTHLVTYYNGKEQPLQVLAHGLPRYIALQEGLAVLAEYLSGGIDARRLRIFGCRVLATKAMLDGAELPDVFRTLIDQCSLPEWIAYRLASRVFRGGGLTKDLVYLRGLRMILGMLHHGAALEPMYLGKVSFGSMALIQRLLERGVLRPPAVLPRFLTEPDARERIARLRRGVGVHELIQDQEET